jgi:diguanylate cyclase (GGDEF)-like protein/PAS domain S-box-containing protein
LLNIGGYPIYLLVGLAREDYLKPWKSEAWVGGGLFTLLTGTALIFCLSMRRRWHADLQMRSMQATQTAYDHLAAVMAAIPDSLFEMDIHGRYLASPAGSSTSSGLPASELVGRNVYEVMPADAAQTVMAALAEARREGRSCGAELHFQHIDGDTWIELSVARKDDHGNGEPTLIVLSRDITERKQAQAQIEKLAFSDLLTQLPNRRLFLDRLKQSMANSQRSGRKVGALLFLDLDQFKAVNDTMGHHFGDLLLVKTAQRLTQLMRQGGTVARLGGDEFVIILEQLSDGVEEAASIAMSTADDIVRDLDAQYELYDRIYHSTVSVGVTLFRGQDVAIDELLKRADMSMYQAKLAGRNAVRFFDPQTQTAIETRLAMEVDMQRALREQEFILHYQPQINQSGTCVGVEALIRWDSKTRGCVHPADFIPLAEATGLICRIGNWVLREACAQLKRWQDMPEFSRLTIAVNVSARQFSQATFVEEVCGMVEEFAINPALLKLELTESMLIEKVDEVVARMSALRAIGINFSLDDFGTGFSSLSYLKRLPFAQIKIDRSFALDVLVDANDAAICHAIIALGNVLGLEVMAEGIETLAQWKFLNAAGCSHGQGYMIGRPMTAPCFEKWLLDALEREARERQQDNQSFAPRRAVSNGATF